MEASGIVVPCEFSVRNFNAISSRAAYNLCKSTKDFKVIRIGKSVRVNKQSFDNWLASA